MRAQKMKVQVLIAGGAGFVGSNLARTLLDRGVAVDCVDNLITGRIESIRDLLSRPDFRFIKGDIGDPRILARLLRRRYAEIYNLACPTGVPNIAILGENMLVTSSVGSLNLLKVARWSKARYLFASTAEAYGDPKVFPQAETYVGNVDPVGPRSAYEEGKRFGEALTVFYARRYGIDARVVRIFNTFGPYMSPDDQRVIPQMLKSVISHKPVVIFGDGLQTRTFLYVDDLIEGFLRVMEKGGSGEVYNIGGDKELTILELFEIVRSVAKVDSAPMFKDHFISDHARRLPDLSKVKALGWRQKMSIRAGIETTYAHMQQALTSGRSDSVGHADEELTATAAAGMAV
jgi:nucleoside-diphosphate-sugar epimerase